MEVGRAKYAAEEELPFGIDPDDYDDDENGTVSIWPENVDAVLFWSDCCDTQWNAGAGGYTGLRYESIRPIVYDEFEDKDKAKDVFWCVRQIERGALAEMARQVTDERKKNARK